MLSTLIPWCRSTFSGLTSTYIFSSPDRLSCAAMATTIRIAVVGDIHNDWDSHKDKLALEFLQAGIFSFAGHRILIIGPPPPHYSNLGDMGNENVELVRSIANLEMPKAVILGNHDSWYTQQFSTKKKDGVQLQLECLGKEHVGYRRLDFPMLKLTVVGGRPFSCGGEKLFRKHLLLSRYGISDMDGSAKKISQAALGTPKDHSVILLAHNGPKGLGSNISDICGKDWVRRGGDHGDPDLAQAIAQLTETSKLSIPLVVFGHMHKELAYRNGSRKMMVIGSDNIIYLNGAIVPRVKRLDDDSKTSNRTLTDNKASPPSPESRGTLRAFTMVEFLDGRLTKIVETWVSVIGEQTAVEDELVLFDILQSSI